MYYYLFNGERERIIDLFEFGFISKEAYFEFEEELEANEMLFTVCLN